MWYLINKETGQQVCYSKNKADLEALIKDAKYAAKWELVYGD